MPSFQNRGQISAFCTLHSAFIRRSAEGGEGGRKQKGAAGWIPSAAEADMSSNQTQSTQDEFGIIFLTDRRIFAQIVQCRSKGLGRKKWVGLARSVSFSPSIPASNGFGIPSEAVAQYEGRMDCIAGHFGGRDLAGPQL